MFEESGLKLVGSNDAGWVPQANRRRRTLQNLSQIKTAKPESVCVKIRISTAHLKGAGDDPSVDVITWKEHGERLPCPRRIEWSEPLRLQPLSQASVLLLALFLSGLEPAPPDDTVP